MDTRDQQDVEYIYDNGYTALAHTASNGLRELNSSIVDLVEYLEANDYAMTPAQLNKTAAKLRNLVKKRVELRAIVSQKDTDLMEVVITTSYLNRANRLQDVDEDLVKALEND